MLGELERGACEQLCASVRERALEPGESLFEQGDAEDAMYVVRSGLLELVHVECAPRASASAHAELGAGAGAFASHVSLGSFHSSAEHVINRVGPGTRARPRARPPLPSPPILCAFLYSYLYFTATEFVLAQAAPSTV